MLEVRRSLQTYDPAFARQLVLVYAARVLKVFEVLRITPLTKPEAVALVQSCFHDLAKGRRPWGPGNTGRLLSRLAYDRLSAMRGTLRLFPG